MGEGETKMTEKFYGTRPEVADMLTFKRDERFLYAGQILIAMMSNLEPWEAPNLAEVACDAAAALFAEGEKRGWVVEDPRSAVEAASASGAVEKAKRDAALDIGEDE